MDCSHNVNQVPISRSERLRSHAKWIAGFVLERHTITPNEYRPSQLRDVGKTASQAVAVQLVIDGMQNGNQDTWRTPEPQRIHSSEQPE